ncbi:MAG: glycosyltransferase family 4 protein [Thermodesulfobacteriota bacterium]|nr:glycosyltransferase family 4 protein [Thermodesulfobacteriota bacterium]
MSARIALFLPKLSAYGGTEGFSLRLAKALAEQGYGVDFVCARQETDPPLGVKVVRLGRPGPSRAVKIAWFAKAAERIRRKNKYDLCIGFGNTVKQDLLRIGGGPLKIFWELSKRAYGPGFPQDFKMLKRRLSPGNTLIRNIEKQALSGRGTIVAVSHRVRDWLIAAHPHLKDRNIRVIYNQPDLERFSPAAPDERQALRQNLGLNKNDTLLTFAGTNFALKGLIPLIKALSLLPENFKLHIAGHRNPGRFAKLAASLGVGERVRFLGYVKDMPSFYRAGDVFVLPSFYDACSNAVLEALASGSRVVSSKDNGSGFFLPERWVIKDPSDVRALARTIKSAAGESQPPPFSWPKDVPAGMEPYLELVKELLEAK